MKEILTIKVISELKLIHNPDLSDRTGYDPNFLDINLPLPKIKKEIQSEIALNQYPKSNGSNYLDYSHYSVMFNKSYKLPVVTAVNIIGETNELARIHEARGSDKWFQDQRIKVGDSTFQFDDPDYAGSGFQKGHMVRYYDPAWDLNEEQRQIAQGDTFYYTNCCPQIQGLNVGVWNDLEDYYMARAIFQDKRVTVFSGPVLRNLVRVKKLDVPLNFWKVIVFRKGDSLSAMGFIVTHEWSFNKMILENLIYEVEGEKLVKPTLKQSDIDRLYTNNLKQWQVKISFIEEKTGLSFGLNELDEFKDKPAKFVESINKMEIEDLVVENVMDKFLYEDFEPFDEAKFFENL